MLPAHVRSVLVASLSLLVLASTGCERDTSTLEPAPLDTDPVVFGDGFGDAVDFQAFLNSKLDAVSLDPAGGYQGSTGMLITVPGPGHPTEWFAGGAFTTPFVRDLSGYNALTFRAKASTAVTLDVVGFGNDNSGLSKFTAEWSGIPLTTSWEYFIVPIPRPAKLGAEGGLFYFAEGAEGSSGHQIWFDDVQFDVVNAISDPRPVMADQEISSFAGDTIAVQGTSVTFAVDGVDRTITHMPGYFSFLSSDENVVQIADDLILVVGGGSATISAKLDDVDVEGSILVTSTDKPAAAAPTPTFAADDVISLFSNEYTDVTVDTWSAEWDAADVAGLQIAGDDAKIYTNLSFAGIEFISAQINASEMTHFHMHIWLPEGDQIKVKLVDFGADGEYGGDDREHELVLTPNTTPSISTGEWVELHIPLAEFTNLTTVEHLAQLIISGNVNTTTLYVDNILFHR